MSDSREGSILRGIAEVQKGISVTQAAARAGVPESTLRYRLKNNNRGRAASREGLKLLSGAKEAEVAAWCVEEHAAGRAVSQKELRARVRAMVGGGEGKVGRDWVKGFLRRNRCVRAGERNKIVPATEGGEVQVLEVSETMLNRMIESNEEGRKQEDDEREEFIERFKGYLETYERVEKVLNGGNAEARQVLGEMKKHGMNFSISNLKHYQMSERRRRLEKEVERLKREVERMREGLEKG